MKNEFSNSEEILKWLNEKFRVYKIKEDQRMLSRFMKESESGKLSDEMTKWWLNRY